MISKEDDFTEINGIGKKTEEKLKSAGFKTFKDLESASFEKIKDVKGISNATAENIKDYIKNQTPNFKKEDINNIKTEVVKINPLKRESNKNIIGLNNLDKYIKIDNKNANSNLKISKNQIKNNDNDNNNQKIIKEIVNQEEEIRKNDVLNENVDCNEDSNNIDYEEETLDENLSKLPDYNQLSDILNNDKTESKTTKISEKEYEIEDKIKDKKITEIEDDDVYKEYNEDNDNNNLDSNDSNKNNYDETEFNGDFSKLPDINRLLNKENTNSNNRLSNVINEFINKNAKESEIIVEEKEDKEKEFSLLNEENEKSHDELLSNVEIQKIDNYSKGVLKALNYYIFPKKIKGTDLLAIKIVKVKDLVNHIIIIPLKVLNLKGSIIVSNEALKYVPADHMPKQIQILIQKEYLIPLVENLVKVPKSIYNNINKEGSIFRFLKSYLKLNIKIEKSRAGTILFFRDGLLQFKIFIEPLVICQDETHSSENSIAFPYFSERNLHIINCNKLQNLVNYLETKYKTIEKYDKEKDNDITQYFRIKNKTFDRLRLLSIPFVLYSVIFLFLIIFQFFAAIRIFNILSYGVLLIYGLIIFYIYYNFYIEKKSIIEKSKEPYYKRKVEMDDYDLNFLKEELDFDILKQFSFECINFENEIKLTSSLNKITNNNLTENISIVSTLEKNPLRSTTKSKYGTFLED